MRRLLVIAVLCVAFVATAAFAVATMVSTRLAEAEIAKRIDSWTSGSGGSVTFGSKPQARVFPTAGVTVEDVVVSGGEGADAAPRLAVPSLDVSLALWPLLVGRVEVKTLTLKEPRIHLTGNADAGVTPAEALRSVLSDNADMQVREVVVNDAAVTYEYGGSRQAHPITTARLQLDRDDDPSASLSGALPWCGRMIRFDAELDDPAAALSGSPTRGRVMLAVDPEPVPENGDRDAGDGGSGATARQGVSPMQRLARLVGVPTSWRMMFGSLNVTGAFAVEQSRMTLSDAVFEFGNATAEGRASVGLHRDRPSLQRLLASDEHDLCLYVRMLEAASFAELRKLPMSVGWLSHADIDFAASADSLAIGDLEIADMAVDFASRDGRMTLRVQGEGAAGGSMDADLVVEQLPVGGPEASVRLSGRLDDVSVTHLGEIVWARWGHPLLGAGRPPQGTGSGEFDFSARGDTVGALFASPDGSATADIRDGSIGGANIVATLERLMRNDKVMVEGEAPLIPVAGRTDFTRFEGRVHVAAGIAVLDRFHIAGDRFEITLSGEGDLSRGDLEAVGAASLFDAASDTDPQPLVELPFGVGGTLREPVIAHGVPRGEAGSDTSSRPLSFNEIGLVRESGDQ